MSFISDHRHAFVIQLWREPQQIGAPLTSWRGIIEHIPSGQRSAISTADDITQFIGDYVVFPNPSTTLWNSLRAKLNRLAPSKSEDEESPLDE